MINVLKIKNSLFDENCYIVFSNVTRAAVIIDPGSDFDVILNAIKGLKIMAVLLTHGHFDHIMSCAKLQELGFKVYISEKDAKLCLGTEKISFDDMAYCFDTFAPDYKIKKNEDELIFADLTVKILHVPGHSKGGLAYIIDCNLFSGDTLFFNGYGRTDLIGGNVKEILNSVNLLSKYTKNGYNLFPGHDY